MPFVKSINKLAVNVSDCLQIVLGSSDKISSNLW